MLHVPRLVFFVSHYAYMEELKFKIRSRVQQPSLAVLLVPSTHLDAQHRGGGILGTVLDFRTTPMVELALKPGNGQAHGSAQ